MEDRRDRTRHDTGQQLHPHVGPANLTNANGTVFFTADDVLTGVELWKTDGTEPDTVLVKDIRAGTAPSNPALPTVAGGAVFFAADGGLTGAKSGRPARGRDAWLPLFYQFGFFGYGHVGFTTARVEAERLAEGEPQPPTQKMLEPGCQLPPGMGISADGHLMILPAPEGCDGQTSKP